MRLVTRYLVGGIALRLCITLPAVVLVYLVSELADSGRRAAATQGWAQVLEASLLHAPLVMVQVLPVALLLSIVLWIGWLRRRGELQAFAACGRSPRALLFGPLLGAGLVATFSALIVSEGVVPWCEARADALLGHRPSLLTGNQQAVSWVRHSDWFYHREGSGRLLALHVTRDHQRQYRVAERIEGSWTKGSTLTDVQRWLLGSDEFVRQSPARVELPSLVGADALFDSFKAETHSYSSLAEQLQRRGAAGQRWRAEKMMLHAKLAYPFINLVLAAAGLLLPLARQRPIVSDLALSLVALLGLWVLLAGGWLAGRTGWVPVVAAAWGPTVLAAVVVSLLAGRAAQNARRS